MALEGRLSLSHSLSLLLGALALLLLGVGVWRTMLFFLLEGRWESRARVGVEGEPPLLEGVWSFVHSSALVAQAVFYRAWD